ncbi:S41 family peptidase [Chitinophaga sp. NPDC101104]|uniref:S41 family peptidase n=1 Tax=Chitinophaga sp. NPDC101104 TaxID=3390561 RepID=UPI003CFEEB45
MTKLQTLCACLAAGIALSACKKDRKTDDPGSANQNKYVNDWIYKNMKEVYYWTGNIPANPDRTVSPPEFFSSLLKRPEDRYSWIQDNFEELLASLSGVSKESGIDYDLFLVGGNPYYLAGIVEYVKKGSPAEAAGIVRGDVFVDINGQPVRYTGLQSEVTKFVEALGQPHSLGIRKVVTGSDGKDSLTDARAVQLSVVELAENPLYLDSVYTIEGKKIGYFVYNFFAPDKGDNTNAYDNQVDAVFGRFKSAGVQHLILDLRYNPGGDSRSTINLGSNIVKGLDPNKTFFYRKFNDAYRDALIKAYGESIVTSKFTNEANNIGNQLTNFIVLTSSGTASASELIINGLRPYMEVYLMGDTTVGKNLGSISIYEENDRNNKWGMQPIVSQAFNSADQSDYTGGFRPLPQDVYQEGLRLGTLGDIHEPLLAKALTRVLGHAPAGRKAAPEGYRTVIDKIATSRSFKAYSGHFIDPLPKRN